MVLNKNSSQVSEIFVNSYWEMALRQAQRPGGSGHFDRLSDPVRRGLVAAEEVAGVDFVGDVGEGGVEAVGDDGVRAGLELGEVADHLAAEEGGAGGEGRLVDDDLGALGLDALHYALHGALAEVVGAGLHREAVDTDDAFFLSGAVVLAVAVVVAGPGENLVGYEVLAGAVGVDDGLDEVLRDVVVVGEQLFGVLREAVAAVAEGRVVVVRADAGVETDPVDDGAGVKALHLGVGVQLVEVADTEGKVGVGEELHGLGLGRAHKEDRHVLLDGSLGDETGEGVGGIL